MDSVVFLTILLVLFVYVVLPVVIYTDEIVKLLKGQDKE